MTMRGTGIVEWLRSNGRLTLLDGFDASKPYEERLEIRRRALLSDLFITGVNAVTEQEHCTGWTRWATASHRWHSVPER